MNNTPLISHEIPKALFSQHHLISDYPYALCHLLHFGGEHFDFTYASFYKEIIKEYDYSILDNSCLDYYTKVRLSNGKVKLLGEIVKQKLEVEVLSYNKITNKIEPKKVTNWFNNGVEKTDWYKIVYKGSKTNKKKGRTGVRCTGDHKIWTKDRGYVLARELKVGDFVCTGETLLSKYQKQLLLGTLIGDGSIWKTSDTSRPTIRISHSDKQLGYLEFKKSILNKICKEIRVQKNNERGFNKREGALLYSIETQRKMQFEEFYQKLYSKHSEIKSYVPILEELDWFGLCVWYLDDGSTNKGNKSSTISIALSNLLEEDEVEIPLVLKRKFNLDCVVKTYNSYKVLEFNVESTKHIFANICKYVPENMKYKVHPNFIDLYEKEKVSEDYYTQFETDDVWETEIEMIIQKGVIRKTKYDITVEGNHNYFADGILVSNCFELGDSYNPEILYQIGEEYKPSHLILPDALHNKELTKTRALSYLSKYENKSTPKFIGVLQGKSIEEFVELYNFYCTIDSIEVIAVPFDLFTEEEYNITKYKIYDNIDYKVHRRAVVDDLISKVKEMKKPLHLLGCATPNEFTLYSERLRKYIKSVDTSAPIIYGWNNVKFEDNINLPLTVSKPKEKLAENLDILLNKEQLNTIAHNVRQFRTNLFNK